jgi:hypothetical protein
MNGVTAKRTLALEDFDAQTALELPERETPALVVVTCLAVCIGEIRIQVQDVNVAAALCAQVLAITVLGANVFDCDVRTGGQR